MKWNNIKKLYYVGLFLSSTENCVRYTLKGNAIWLISNKVTLKHINYSECEKKGNNCHTKRLQNFCSIFLHIRIQKSAIKKVSWRFTIRNLIPLSILNYNCLLNWLKNETLCGCNLYRIANYPFRLLMNFFKSS